MVFLGDVIEINPESISKDYQYNQIEYIDISSVGTGTLLGTKIYDLKDAPGRAKRIVKDGDTIVATVRPNLRSFLYIKNPKPNLVVSTGFAVLRPSEKIDSRFLYYTVADQSFTDYLVSRVKGAAYPAVDVETFKQAEINLPPLPIQRKIAAILSAYDDLIENNTRRIKILEEMAQLIYRDWFVKFRFPGHEKVRMVDSELGPIPEGWKVKKLGEVCNILMGQSPKSKYYNTKGEGLPFHQGVSNFNDRYPTHEVYCTIDKRIAHAGDILFSVRAPVGRINIADRKLIVGRGLAAIRHKAGLQSFLYYQLKAIFKEEDIIGNGAIFNSITKQDLLNVKVIVPSDGVDNDFNNMVEHIDQLILSLTRKNTILRRTRDLLLPKLISGELDVEDLDIAIGGD